MTDRELLELAAKAADVKDYGIDGFFDPTRREWWNPLTDDGDALRLAVKLHHMDSFRVANIFNEQFGEDDLYAATRRAIVRAAAAIGKEIK